MIVYLDVTQKDIDNAENHWEDGATPLKFMFKRVFDCKVSIGETCEDVTVIYLYREDFSTPMKVHVEAPSDYLNFSDFCTCIPGTINMFVPDKYLGKLFKVCSIPHVFETGFN